MLNDFKHYSYYNKYHGVKCEICMNLKVKYEMQKDFQPCSMLIWFTSGSSEAHSLLELLWQEVGTTLL